MDNFEKTLVDNIIKSLDEEPELWDTSIMGLVRNDELELNIGISSYISIYKPYEYKFKDKLLEKKLLEKARDVRDKIRKLADKTNESENKKKLSEFLKLNDRKNKLEHLNKISPIDETSDKKRSFLKKLFGNF